MTTNSEFPPELRISNPADMWGEKPVHQSMQANVASDRSNATIASSKTATADANRALNMPFDYALDPATKCRISPYELQENSLLSFGGEPSVTVAQARAVGLLPPDWRRPGTYPDQVQAQQQARQENGQTEINDDSQQQETPEDLQFDLLPDLALDQKYSSLIDNTGGIEQAAALKQVVEAGEIDPRTLGALASQLRMEPGALQAEIAPIMDAFKAQALSVMGEGGLDAADVLAYSQQRRQGELKQAMTRQGLNRQAGGYALLREAYLEDLASWNKQAALTADLGAGVTQYEDGGRVIVRFPDGSTHEWRNCIRNFMAKRKA